MAGPSPSIGPVHKRSLKGPHSMQNATHERIRTIQACECCREKKRKCDGVRPTCGSCKRKCCCNDACQYSPPQVTGTIRRDLEALRDEFEAQRNAGPILEEAVAAERQANQQAFRELRNAIKTIGKKTQELTKLAERQVEEIEQEKLRNKKAYQELSSKVEAISTQTQEAILSATQEVRQAKQESEKQYAALYSMLVAVGIVVKGNEQSLQVERRRLQSLSEGFACMPSSSEAMVYGQHTILEDSTIMPGSEASTLGGDMVTRELDKSNRRIDATNGGEEGNEATRVQLHDHENGA